MPDEYDAFGRKAGEDPLGGLGWSSTTAETTPSVEVDTSPAVESVPAPGPAPVELALRSARWARRITLLVVFGAVGFGVYQGVKSATDEVRDVVDEVTRAIPTTAAPSSPDQPAGDEDAPRPSRPASLIGRGELAGALRRLQADVPGRLRTFRLEASRIDVSVHLKGGRIRTAQLAAGAQAAQIFSTTPGGFPGVGLFRYSDVDPSAPMRLVRAAGERLDRGPGKVNYLVLSRFGEQLQWGVYYKDGAIAIGDGRGRFQRRIS